MVDVNFKKKSHFNFLQKESIFRGIYYVLVLVAISFLVKVFLENWQKISSYEWHFNFGYLVLALLISIFQLFFLAMIWRKIILFLEPEKTISRFLAIRIHVFSIFGKYLPGISWSPVAKLYFSQKSEFSSPKLAVSVIYENLISVIAGFMLSLFLLSTFFKLPMFNSYFGSVAVIVLGSILVYPKIFYRLTGFVTNLLRREAIPRREFLKTGDIVKITFHYFFFFILGGLGLYFLVNSVFPLPITAIPVVVGAYTLAIVSGVVVLFAPSGIGVREAVLVAILSSYFSVESSILISILARAWTTAAEIVSFVLVWTYGRFKLKT